MRRADRALIAFLAIVFSTTAARAVSPPVLNAVSSPTTSNPYSITGTAPAGALVTMYVNGELLVTSNAHPSTGAFTIPTPLYDGSNSISATATVAGSTSASSNVVSLTYNNTVSRTQSGTISVNTVWTPGTGGGTPYSITGDLTIASGVSLVLQPGATLKFSTTKQLIVNGTLWVRGTGASQVVLTSAAGSPARGDWKGVLVNASSVGTVLTYAKVEYAVRAVEATGATSVTVTSSTIREFSTYGIRLATGASGTLSANTVDNSAGAVAGTGISIETAVAAISGSLIKKTTYGINLYQASPSITGSTIRDGQYGLYIARECSPTINGGNVITANSWYGIYVWGIGAAATNPNPVVNGNDIYGNALNDYYAGNFGTAGATTSLNAKNNWWGTVDPVSISAKIYDRTDSPTNSPLVDFTPFLGASGGSAVSGNYLNGTVSGGTTLTGGTPYDVVGSIRVAAGTTVTVTAGATFRFAPGAALYVDGTLSVLGTVGAPVLLTSLKTIPARGDWAGLVVSSTSTGTQIQNATIQYAATAIDASGAISITLTGSTIREFATSGIRLTTGAGGTFSSNTIDNTAGGQNGSGFNLDTAGATTITGSLIKKATYGLYLLKSSPALTANTIRDNQYGVYIMRECSPPITGGNLVTANSYGIYVLGNGTAAQNPNPLVNGNELSANTLYNYYATNFGSSTTTSINARSNYWGGTDVGAIATKLYDRTDSPTSSPLVDFTPFLNAAGGAPVAGSYLNGTIAGGTTIAGGATYDVAGSIRVAAGTTVTIAAGATLRFVPGASLYIDGTLLVPGTSGSPVVLTSTQAAPLRGDWVGLVVASTSTGTLIQYATIQYATSGIAAAGATSVTVSGSTIREFATYGVRLTAGAGGAFSSNTVDNTTGGQGGSGFSLDTAASGVTISANVVKKATYGVYLYKSSPVVTANTIRDSQYGIYVAQESSPAITTNNLITVNSYGIYVLGNGTTAQNPNPLVNGNELSANTIYNYYASNFGSPATTTLDAKANYWGTVDPVVIGNKLYDRTDSASSPTVAFTPFLDANGQPVGGGNYLNGGLASNTTLTTGTTYDVVGTVTVNSGVTLTIQSGATLRFAPNTALSVTGTLLVQGTSGSPVLLTSRNAIPARGDWTGIVVAATSTGTQIQYATIEYASRAIEVTGASVTISNVTIREFGYGIRLLSGATGTLTSNTIDNTTGGQGGTGVAFESAGGSLASSTVKKCATGVLINQASPTLTGNTIRDSGTGISVGFGSSPTINGGNVITANNIGVAVSGNGVAAQNPSPSIHSNQIYANTSLDLSTGAFGNPAASFLDVDTNWWGSTSAPVIAAKVGDRKTNTSAPVVDFTPYLNAAGGTPVAGTYLDRPVSSNTTLTSGATYEVTSQIGVNQGTTLTIPAGVTLRFVGSAGLEVYGTVLSQGTSGSLVTLTSDVSPQARGDWDGIKLTATSTGTSLNYTRIDYAVRGIEVQGAPITMTHGEVRQVPNLGAGLYLSGGATGTISANLFDNTQIGTKQGVGIYLSGSSPAISGNTIRGFDAGLSLFGAANPTIDGGNVITGNDKGILLAGSFFTGGPQPAPVIRRNDLSGNVTKALSIQDYTNVGATLSLDVRENWWGTTTAATIAGLVGQTTPNGSAPLQVDFSDFLNAAGGTPIVAARFMAALTAISTSVPSFRPTFAETVDIRFTIPLPLTVTVTLCAELDSGCATPLRTYSQSYGTSGAKIVTWDGKSTSGTTLADEAYTYRIVASDGVPDGVNEATYDPARPTYPQNGATTFNVPTSFNGFKNEGLHFTFTLPLPGRLDLRHYATPVWSGRPYPAGANEILWDGRTAAGALLSGSLYVDAVVAASLKTNSVIVKGTKPDIRGTGLAPNIEVKSNPYLVVHSFEQVSRIAYRIDQDAYVTVKMLPPGVTDPASPSAITVIANELESALSGGQPLDHIAEWRGYAAAAPRVALFADQGSFTFTIQATQATTGFTSLYRGALQVQR